MQLPGRDKGDTWILLEDMEVVRVRTEDDCLWRCLKRKEGNKNQDEL